MLISRPDVYQSNVEVPARLPETLGRHSVATASSRRRPGRQWKAYTPGQRVVQDLGGVKWGRQRVQAADESACTPGSVPARRMTWPAAAIHLGLPSPAGSSGPPAGIGRATLNRLRRPRPSAVALLTLLRVGFTEPSRSPGMLVGSYPTVSPLPTRPWPRRRSDFCGTVPRVTPGCR
jgi:hypothetical protein